MATDTLESRVCRLEQILANRVRDTDTASGQDDASVAALKQFSMALRSVQQLTDEIRSRIGAGAWDAGDVLAARLLLDSLTSALRSCRFVSDETTLRLRNIDLAVREGGDFLRREAARKP